MEYKNITDDSGLIIIETEKGQIYTLYFEEPSKSEMKAKGWHYLDEEYWPEDGQKFTALMYRYDIDADRWRPKKVQNRYCLNDLWGPSGGILPHDGYDSYTDLYVAWKVDNE